MLLFYQAIEFDSVSTSKMYIENKYIYIPYMNIYRHGFRHGPTALAPLDKKKRERKTRKIVCSSRGNG